MDNQQQEEQEHKLKELTKKYFWEQKATEICLFILIILGVIAAMFISGSIMVMLDPEMGNIPLFAAGIIGLMLFAIIGACLFLIFWGSYVGIKEWIKDNKERASDRARKELGVEENE